MFNGLRILITEKLSFYSPSLLKHGFLVPRSFGEHRSCSHLEGNLHDEWCRAMQINSSKIDAHRKFVYDVLSHWILISATPTPLAPPSGHGWSRFPVFAWRLLRWQHRPLLHWNLSVQGKLLWERRTMLWVVIMFYIYTVMSPSDRSTRLSWHCGHIRGWPLERGWT